jgi:hypothetical protein
MGLGSLGESHAQTDCAIDGNTIRCRHLPPWRHQLASPPFSIVACFSPPSENRALATWSRWWWHQQRCVPLEGAIMEGSA